MTDPKLISQLLFKDLQGTLTEAEKLLLDQWKLAGEDNLYLLEELYNDERLNAFIVEYHPENKSAIEDKIFKKVEDKIPELVSKPITRKIGWWKYAAAAVVLLSIGIGIIEYFGERNFSRKKTIAVVPKAAKDIAPPTGTNAVLTLANGQTILLDNRENGSLAIEGHTDIVKVDDGKIAYKGKGNMGAVQYNTLTVPKGSRVTTITLSDGTIVTLNAASSLTYPVAFNGTERKVRITGEAYFEVAKDLARRFIVEGGDITTEVLGTHFNVNAYPDEHIMRVTLVEGSIKVMKEQNQSIVLRPGQQASVENNKLQLVKSADLESALAWKNGLFVFKGADLPTIMRSIARAYDVEVVYQNIPDEKFHAEVSRNTNISTLLNILELTNVVHFTIEGKKITVMK